jgi:hypothetical protein
MSNSSGTPNTVIDVAAGTWTESGQAEVYARRRDHRLHDHRGHGLDTGSLANSTWYHAFAIKKTDGTTAFLASTGASSPTMPSAYTLKRKINGSVQILAFSQNGDEFLWASRIQE